MCAKQWKSIVALGDDALRREENTAAITYYQKALKEAEMMIERSIFEYDGDTGILKRYTKSCRLLVNACLQADKSNTALSYIAYVCDKLLVVIKNPAYAFELRGKAIREFEPLFTMIKSYYQNREQPEKAIEFIQTRLGAIQNYLQQMKPLQQQIQNN